MRDAVACACPIINSRIPQFPDLKAAASDRGRNAKHPAKVLTLNRWTRHRTIPAPTPAIRPRTDAAASEIDYVGRVFRPATRGLCQDLDHDAAGFRASVPGLFWRDGVFFPLA